jgi:hypothetical protein
MGNLKNKLLRFVSSYESCFKVMYNKVKKAEGGEEKKKSSLDRK